MHDGRTTDFLLDKWIRLTSLAAQFPALHSHCDHIGISVSEVLEAGIHNYLVPRLTQAARGDLDKVTDLIQDIDLLQGTFRPPVVPSKKEELHIKNIKCSCPK